MARKKKQKVALNSSDGGSSLGDLLKLKGFDAPETPPPAEPPAPQPAKGSLADAPKMVLRKEKKGHGGKTVTRIDGVPEPLRESTRKTLASHLGTGCRVNGDSLIIQGDQRNRVRTWLESQGVTNIVG
jgi:translation initiation factor 1